MATFTAPIPIAPPFMRDRAERLATIAHALGVLDPLPSAMPVPPHMPQALAMDGNEQRFHKLVDANRELYSAEYQAFLTEAREYRNAVEEWALQVCNEAKTIAGTPSGLQQPAAPAQSGPSRVDDDGEAA